MSGGRKAVSGLCGDQSLLSIKQACRVGWGMCRGV